MKLGFCLCVSVSVSVCLRVSPCVSVSLGSSDNPTWAKFLVSRTDDAILSVLCCVLCVSLFRVVYVVGVQCVGVGVCVSR